jgi:hypothetical protein
MPSQSPIETTNLDIYGNEALPWSRAQRLLDSTPAGPELPIFLSTVRPDGRPHTAGVGALWVDGDFFIVSGPKTRKSKNLANNPACTLAVPLDGLHLVLEGTVERVTDGPTLEQVAARYRDVGWPAEVEKDAFSAPFSAPSAGPPPWHLYRFAFHTAFGVASKEPNGATRWRFEL